MNVFVDLPYADELLTIGELEANTKKLAAEVPELVTVRPIGASLAGRTIDLVSVGEGDRDALIVGVPHPNEPAGAVTIERMIALLIANPDFRRHSGYRWHFIKAIDPDGLKLNEGWLKGPRNLRRYLRDFYRPATLDQPEYTFPLTVGSHVFDRPTPENQAWQMALELTRPSLQASLHHADHGGVFHCVSRDVPDLYPELVRQTAAAGLTLNTVGEPAAPLTPLSAGVFGFPDMQEFSMKSASSGEKGSGWAAGDSSAGYAAKRYGTFSITTEMPLWDDDRLREDRDSLYTDADVRDMQLRMFTDLANLLRRHLPLLHPLAISRDMRNFAGALAESQQLAERFCAILEAQGGSEGRQATRLSMRDYALGSAIKLAAIRPVAMLSRFAQMVGADCPSAAATTASVEADECFERELAAFEAEAELIPVAVATMADVQMTAIFAAAESLKGIKG